MTKLCLLLFLSLFLLSYGKLKTSSNSKNSITSKHFLPGSNNSNPEVRLLDGELEGYCFANIQGVVYDLSPLYDASGDYIFKTGGDTIYLNFCKFGVTKCKKDNAFVISAKTGSVNNSSSTDCSLLSGTNYENFPKWKITSKSK
jgi:hypothetical protein